MLRKILVFSSLFSLLITAAPVSAKSNNDFKLKDSAVQISDNLYSLGLAVDPVTHQKVQGYAYVHKKSDVKVNASRAPKSPTCYGYMADGAKWKTNEPWVFNPANPNGLSEATLFSTEAADIQKWENAASFNILGNGTATSNTLVADQTTPDNVNEVYFGNIADNNTIAVTIVWGIFSGPTFNRRLTEWDQVFNTHYPWSLTGEAGKMDFENISTHELGHAMGMDDIYNASCSAVTMYGYADFGQTNKRTLEQPDITGISQLY